MVYVAWLGATLPSTNCFPCAWGPQWSNSGPPSMRFVTPAPHRLGGTSPRCGASKFFLQAAAVTQGTRPSLGRSVPWARVLDISVSHACWVCSFRSPVAVRETEALRQDRRRTSRRPRTTRGIGNASVPAARNSMATKPRRARPVHPLSVPALTPLQRRSPAHGLTFG